jgi:hypothetical protein
LIALESGFAGVILGLVFQVNSMRGLYSGEAIVGPW